MCFGSIEIKTRKQLSDILILMFILTTNWNSVWYRLKSVTVVLGARKEETLSCIY